jgi:hypothetical protein
LTHFVIPPVGARANLHTLLQVISSAEEITAQSSKVFSLFTVSSERADAIAAWSCIIQADHK